MFKGLSPFILLALVCVTSLAVGAPGMVATPSLDQVYSQMLELKSRVLKLEVDNRALKTQMAAMAKHTHSMGFRTGGDGGSMSLRLLKFDLDHNICMDCEWMYRVSPQRSSERFTGPPKF